MKLNWTNLIQLDPHLKLNPSKEFLSGENWSKSNQVTIPFLNRFPNFQNLYAHEEKLDIHLIHSKVLSYQIML